MHLMVALALKGIDYEYKAVNLVKDGGQQVLSAGVAYSVSVHGSSLLYGCVCVHVAV